MKTLQLLLIFAIIGYCFTDETEIDECEIQFYEILKTKCAAIGSCTLNDNYNLCVETKECTSVDKDNCLNTIPPKLHLEKCALNAAGTACQTTKKLCSDYNKFGGSSSLGDDCTKLTPPTGQGDRCILASTTSDPCEPHFNECSSITADADAGKCRLNIPKDLQYKCGWDSSKNPKCQPVLRDCTSSGVFIANKTICHGLKLTDTDETERAKKQCIYNGVTCQGVYKLCDYYSDSGEATCESRLPVNQEGNYYDYTKKCTYDGTRTVKCQSADRLCTELTGVPTTELSDDFCEKLAPGDTNKRCIYKGTTCQLEYKTCELYNENEIEKTEAGCEGIILEDKNTKCTYIPMEDKCETRQIYETCDSYKGKDKEICESIISQNTHSKCILDKDSTCKERPMLCSETTDVDDCIYYATASDTNKRCAYDNDPTPTHTPQCYEEYARCEDYLGNDTTICEEIRLYNGNKCEFINDRCRSKYKNCSEALTEEECKLINVTGVTDPDRKVCAYIDYDVQVPIVPATTTPTYRTVTLHYCAETYKYCSDYRGSDTQNCTNIKPYDETGNNLDKYFKCKILDNNLGCEKVPIECEDAGDNAILCAEYSPKIKDSSVKYCAFYGGTCTTQFKTCDAVVNFSSQTTKCTNNVIENYITYECEIDISTNPNKCVRKKSCSSFNVVNYKDKCESINMNCTYDTSNDKCKTRTTSLNCDNIKFYPESEGSEEICNSIEINEPYMICSLREDKSGCEQKYRESRYSSTGANNQDSSSSSSRFIEKGIHLIMILLCLLF